MTCLSAPRGIGRHPGDLDLEHGAAPGPSLVPLDACRRGARRGSGTARGRRPVRRTGVLGVSARACRKRWNRWGRKSASIPAPVSVTTASSWPSSLRTRSDDRPPSGVNFTAFDSRFHSTCWKRPAIEDGLAEVGRDLEVDGDALRLARSGGSPRRPRAPTSSTEVACGPAERAPTSTATGRAGPR